MTILSNLDYRYLKRELGDSYKLAEIPKENIQRELDRMQVSTFEDLLVERGLEFSQIAPTSNLSISSVIERI